MKDFVSDLITREIPLKYPNGASNRQTEYSAVLSEEQECRAYERPYML